MDSPEKLFEQSIDRTPYGACFGVVAIVIILFLVAASALWNSAGWVKRQQWSFPGIAVPSASLPNTTDIGGQVQNSLDNAASSAAQKAADAATQAAKNAAAQQAQNAQNSIQNTLQNNLK